MSIIFRTFTDRMYDYFKQQIRSISNEKNLRTNCIHCVFKPSQLSSAVRLTRIYMVKLGCSVRSYRISFTEWSVNDRGPVLGCVYSMSNVYLCTKCRQRRTNMSLGQVGVFIFQIFRSYTG